MNMRHFAGSLLMLGTMAAMTSGCFATRLVRTDTSTSYDLVRAQADEPAPRIARAPNVVAPPVLALMQPAPEGTLVVEALVIPPPPESSARPVRLPDEVAASAPVVTASAPPQAWDALPSYVGQFATTSWLRRPLFAGGVSPQGSSSFRGWGGTTRGLPFGSSSPTGAYGSASPHFSSPPSFSGSASSHFSSPPSFSGF